MKMIEKPTMTSKRIPKTLGVDKDVSLESFSVSSAVNGSPLLLFTQSINPRTAGCHSSAQKAAPRGPPGFPKSSLYNTSKTRAGGREP